MIDDKNFWPKMPCVPGCGRSVRVHPETGKMEPHRPAPSEGVGLAGVKRAKRKALWCPKAGEPK